MQPYPPGTSIWSIAWEEFCVSPTAWTAGMIGAIRAIAVSQTAGRTDIVAEGYVPRSKQAEKIAAARHVLEDVFQTALLVHGSTQHSAATDRQPAAGGATRPGSSPQVP